MKNICVIFGGKSVESEVSIITAKFAMQNFDFTKYKMFPVFIDKSGKWWTGKNFDKVETFKPFIPQKHKKVVLQAGSGGLYLKNKFVKIDCALVCCHGGFGEDGSLSGLLNMLEIPYTCCNVEASSICMNKITMKKMFEHLNLPVTNYICLDKENADWEQLISKLKYPLFVKPANLGSSVGINKCTNLDELKVATEIAFNFDNLLIVEEAVENLIEYNCSSMRYNGEIVASQIEQPQSWSDFLNFEDKYIKKGKKLHKKMKHTKIGQRLEQKIKTMTKLVHSEFGLKGVVRIDYLFDKQSKKLYINEINTIPGSLAFYLWKSEKLSFKDIMDIIISQGIEEYQKRQNLITYYDSSILDKYIKP